MFVVCCLCCGMKVFLKSRPVDGNGVDKIIAAPVTVLELDFLEAEMSGYLRSSFQSGII